MLMLGEDMSIFARNTLSPVSTPLRILSKDQGFLYGPVAPGAVLPGLSQGSAVFAVDQHQAHPHRPGLLSILLHNYIFRCSLIVHSLSSKSNPIHLISSIMASTYSTSSLEGFVSSKNCIFHHICRRYQNHA